MNEMKVDYFQSEYEIKEAYDRIKCTTCTVIKCTFINKRRLPSLSLSLSLSVFKKSKTSFTSKFFASCSHGVRSEKVQGINNVQANVNERWNRRSIRTRYDSHSAEWSV